MKRLYAVTLAVIIMAFLIPLAPYMAISGDSPYYTHFVYMFGHANILHWLINGWALLVLHNLFRPYRLFIAYILSALMTFSPLISHTSPLVGSSVLTCFFFGFMLPWLYYKSKVSAFMMTALILVGFFIPGIAALPHLIMFVSGFCWCFVERIYHSFTNFVNS